MRKFSQVNEAWLENPGKVLPGNSYFSKGVTNHYTPIDNIVTNITNLFGAQMGIVANIGEDGVSIKLYSSRFTSPEKINSMLYAQMFNDINGGSLYNYIVQQGLNKCTTVKIGQDYVVYFSPDDMKQAEAPETQCQDACSDPSCTDFCCPCCPCEMDERLLDEVEFDLIYEDSDEEELKDVTLEKIMELIDSKDKVKAAKQLEILVAQQMELPREYYFAGIKFKHGEESIALRWKYTKKMPNGQSIENTRSLVHIFGKGDKGIWVQDFAKDSIINLPDEVKKLIENFLDLLEAEKTNDPAIYKISGEKKEREEKNKDTDKDKNEDNKKDNNDIDNEDTESDDDRGDSSDNLL